ncbi:MAG: hypothetical protein PVJ61_00010 [Dehalococcoidia bacterium]|jgi:hypothetical protein
MAKQDMICPFSGRLCQQCSLYRGRHYYLCFNKQYRGHLKEGKDTVSTSEATPKRPATRAR